MIHFYSLCTKNFSKGQIKPKKNFEFGQLATKIIYVPKTKFSCFTDIPRF